MTKQEQTRIAKAIKEMREGWEEVAQDLEQPLTQTYGSVGLLLADFAEVILQFPQELVADILGETLLNEIYPKGYPPPMPINEPALNDHGCF